MKRPNIRKKLAPVTKKLAPMKKKLAPVTKKLMPVPVLGAIVKAAAQLKNIPVEIRQNHTDPIRAQKRELRKLQKATKDTGKTIIPLALFINDKGFAKLEIALCQGKHAYDKRQSLREADDRREVAQMLKAHR